MVDPVSHWHLPSCDNTILVEKDDVKLWTARTDSGHCGLDIPAGWQSHWVILKLKEEEKNLMRKNKSMSKTAMNLLVRQAMVWRTLLKHRYWMCGQLRILRINRMMDEWVQRIRKKIQGFKGTGTRMRFPLACLPPPVFCFNPSIVGASRQEPSGLRRRCIEVVCESTKKVVSAAVGSAAPPVSAIRRCNTISLKCNVLYSYIKRLLGVVKNNSWVAVKNIISAGSCDCKWSTGVLIQTVKWNIYSSSKITSLHLMSWEA